MGKLLKKEVSALLILVVVLSSVIFLAFKVNSTQNNSGYQVRDNVRAAVKTDDPITLTQKLNNRYFFDNSIVYLNLDILSNEKPDSRGERTPLNISVVIDKSGSMAEKNKLNFVKKALEHIINELEKDDYISIVTYDDYEEVMLESGRVEDKESIKRILAGIKSGGYTNLSGGMLKGFGEVERTYKRGYVNRVLLLSDGLANRGISDRSAIAELVRERSRKYGVTVSTFGVGNDFNENLMTDIADYGKGNYYYIKSSEDIPQIFAHELNGVRYLTGQDSKIRIQYPSEYLTVSKVFGYPYEIFGDEIMIDLKDIFAGQNRTILIKFDIKKKSTEMLKFRTEFEYSNPGKNLEKVTSTEVSVLEPAGSLEEYNRGYAEKVQQKVVVYEANDIMEQALKEADKGNYNEAKRKVKEGQDYITERMKDVSASPEIEKQEKNLDNYGKELESADTKSEEGVKEMQKSGKYENYNTRKNNNQ
jgi:Ca-activated chloride channel homolog